MRSCFIFSFLLLAVSMSSLGCERTQYREAREEEERFGDPTNPEPTTLAEELGEDE